MPSIKMSADRTFKPICEKALRKFAADLMHLVGEWLHRG